MNDKTAVPPAIMLRQLAFVMRVSRALYAAAEPKLADFLAAGPMTNRELAAEAGVDPPTMRRLMRALVAHGVFEELSVDCFALNAAGELLRRDVSGSQRAVTIMISWEMSRLSRTSWIPGSRIARFGPSFKAGITTERSMRSFSLKSHLEQAPQRFAPRVR